MPAVWRRSIAEALDVIELLDARITAIDHELRPLARADARVVLLDTIPGIGDLLGLTLASEIGDVARFGSPRKLIGYAGLAPKITQSGDRSRTGALSKAGSRTLRWAAVEAAQHAWRPSNPWHALYTDLATRAGKNPAKAASKARGARGCRGRGLRGRPGCRRVRPRRGRLGWERSCCFSIVWVGRGGGAGNVMVVRIFYPAPARSA